VNPDIHYQLCLLNTAGATGYFGCIPADGLDLESGLTMLCQRPWDDFLRQYLLTSVIGLEPAERQRCLLELLAAYNHEAVRSWVAETCVMADEPWPDGMDGSSDELVAATSLIYLRSQRLCDQKLHQPWISLFEANLRQHVPLPAPDATGLAILGPAKSGATDGEGNRPGIASLHRAAMEGPIVHDPWEAEQTAALALKRLQDLDVLEGPESRHLASLSPIAFLRRWRLKRMVSSGRNRYSLEGIQTSYGKGLSPGAARASSLMEIVERMSAFVSVEEGRLPDTACAHRLMSGSLQDLLQKGYEVLDPNRMSLEVPYQGESLHWIEGRDRRGRAIWVPAQAVFLFCNLDEVSLFSALGSTGLASGNSFEGAKVSGLLEVLERDADCVMPFDGRSCFVLDSNHPHLAPLFDAYRSSGIAIGLQEITTEFGVPCYRAFVETADGDLVRGTGAHLDARKAAMSALTEIAHPFPSARPTAATPADWPTLKFEDLPNCDTKDSRANLVILETLLADRGFEPVYVDLSRKDLGFPVVRAIVPGLEVMADFDRFARVPDRLFANYRKLFDA
jgi:ribosomal protein S12 methylthiotransferase accessory factor